MVMKPAMLQRPLAAVMLVHAFNALAQPVPPAASAAPDIAWGQQLFQAHCARCHGQDAQGTAQAPNLLQRVAGMSEDRFTQAVLHRYAWTIAATDATSPEAERQALLGSVVQPRFTDSSMPAWEANAAVRSGIGLLYRYLDTLARHAPR